MKRFLLILMFTAPVICFAGTWNRKYCKGVLCGYEYVDNSYTILLNENAFIVKTNNNLEIHPGDITHIYVELRSGEKTVKKSKLNKTYVCVLKTNKICYINKNKKSIKKIYEHIQTNSGYIYLVVPIENANSLFITIPPIKN